MSGTSAEKRDRDSDSLDFHDCNTRIFESLDTFIKRQCDYKGLNNPFCLPSDKIQVESTNKNSTIQCNMKYQVTPPSLNVSNASHNVGGGNILKE